MRGAAGFKPKSTPTIGKKLLEFMDGVDRLWSRFEFSASGNPGGIMVRPDGAMWFSESVSEQNANANKIGRLTISGDFNRIDRLAGWPG